MNIDALLVTVPKGPKPLALPSDQFEFTIDRAARKVLGFMALFGAGETLRVQANRPFEIDVDVTLPDMTMQVVRNVPCRARIQGQVDNTQEAARRFVETALAADFKFEPLVSRLLETALGDYAKTIQGGFVHHLRETDGHERMQRALVMAFRDAGFPAQRITVAPVMTDVRPTLNFDDANEPLHVRSVGTLESHRVGYKVRLAWGTTDEQAAGRLTYGGSISGRSEGPRLSHPVVAGQTQPLEHWLRILLAEALSREEWPAVVAGDAQMIERVSRTVSKALGAGTGRVVDTLIVLPVIERDGYAESTTKFNARYAITGVRGEGIEVEHAIRFTLVDRDRWQAQGAPDPAAFIKAQVVEAAKSFLIDKRFEDVVALFLQGNNGEKTFRDGIGSRVGASIKAIGHRLDAVATILAIPEMDFIHGRALKLPERTYGLADPHVEPALHIEARVQVRQHEDDGAMFARALAMFKDFEARVAADIEETVRAMLRNVSALSYYSSPYVNGVRTVQDPATGEWRSLAVDDSQFHADMHAAINASLARKFGLEATEFRLVPGEDRLIQRMGELNRSSTTYQLELGFGRGDAETTITLRALATLFIGSIAPEHWSSFHHNANRLTLQEHKEKIRAALEDTLRLMEGLIVNAAPGELQRLNVKEQIVHLFTSRMSEELGLVIRLFPLQLTIERPNAGQIAAMEVAALKLELERLFERRAALVEENTGYGGETRAALTARIGDVKRELEAAGKSQDATLERTQTVRIEQDPRTGRLVDASAEKAPASLPPH
ncbi:hypothetical protein [Aquabacterium humicola]|uniref:hypothetical protein n=1 Tax=Aquabacterium humicola TaxID=3237377 RepID=UPI0025438595|nr:hypothetical protein [Rubrivivax pictus]